VYLLSIGDSENTTSCENSSRIFLWLRAISLIPEFEEDLSRIKVETLLEKIEKDLSIYIAFGAIIALFFFILMK